MNTPNLYILISVLGGGIGQILLKKGMNNLGTVTLSLSDLVIVTWKMMTDPFVFLGLLISGISVFFWLAALSRVELSYAYPFASLGYVILLLASWLLLDETITPLRVLGTIVVGIGVFLISRS
jgi:drug/metabolite transporter (DMT)-like permease